MKRWGKRGRRVKVFSLISEFLNESRKPQLHAWKRNNQVLKHSGWLPLSSPKKAASFNSSAIKKDKLKVKASLTKGQKIKRLLLKCVIIFLLISLPLFIYFETNLRGPLMHVAKIRMTQIATQAINEAITSQVTEQLGAEHLIDWKMDGGGKVSGFVLNYAEHMRITSKTIETVQNTLLNLHHIPEKIPVGHALNSAIISTYGPKIPVYFEPQGAVKVELNTREKNAAINMVLVEVYIKVQTEIAIIIPFDTEPDIVEAEIPISYLLVVGDVPMYYYDSSGKAIGESAPQAPNISVPLQEGSKESISSTKEPNLLEPDGKLSEPATGH